MRGPALLAMRLQLLLAQAACAHDAAAKAGDEAGDEAGGEAGHGAGRGGRGGCSGHHEPAGTSHAQACARALHRALSLLDGAGAACLEELGQMHVASMASMATQAGATAGATAGAGLDGATASTTVLGGLGPPVLTLLAEQLQSCALLQGGSLAAQCHRHALRLLGTAREQLRRGETRLAVGRQGSQQGPQGPPQGCVASELAHLCGRLALSALALRRQQEGAGWLKEAAQHLLRTPPSRASSSSARADLAQLSRELEQEQHPLALARMCSSLRTSRI